MISFLRKEIMNIGLGQCGGNLVDNLVDEDKRHSCFFINSSIEDIKSLNNADDIIKNYHHLPLGQGTGRDRGIGKVIASKDGWNMIDILNTFDQKVFNFYVGLGGGSGSSILSVLLKAIDRIQEDNEVEFDKIINVIGVLPKLESSTQILRNTVETWNELMKFKCVTSMMFIDNNTTIDGSNIEEQKINEKFVELYNEIFDIPTAEGNVYDSTDLAKTMWAKGCTYFYNIPSGYTNVGVALQKADIQSILAKMYKSENNLVVEKDMEKIKCKYLGTSLTDEYLHEDILRKYKPTQDNFHGTSYENNIMIVSGALPPVYILQIINQELEDRTNNKELDEEAEDFSAFTLDIDEGIQRKTTTKTHKDKTKMGTKNDKKNMKKLMRKDLFDFM